MKKKISLGRKILRSMIGIVIGMLLAASVIITWTVKNVSDTLASSNERLNETVGQQSSTYMTEQSQYRILQLSAEKAEIADEIFSDFERAVHVVACVAEQVYSNPEFYLARSVAPPDPKNDGALTTQVLYSASTDPGDPRIIRELELIGNVQDVLLAENLNSFLEGGNFNRIV